MRIIGLVGLMFVILGASGCTKIRYKPYLPEHLRGDLDDGDPSLPGILTGKSGEYTIYGN
jgi:hypothetical protein